MCTSSTFRAVSPADYLDYCRSVRGFSDSTVRDYALYLQMWRDFDKSSECVDSTAGAERALLYDARCFVSSLMERGLSAKTVCNIMSCLSGFFRFQCLMGFGSCNPFERIPRPRLPRHLPKFVTESQVISAIDSIDYTSFEGARQLFAVVFLFRTGLRCAEFTRLRRADVRSGAVFVRDGKFNKDRFVPMLPDVQEIYKWFTAQVDSDFVISDSRGRSIGDRDLRRIIDSALISLPKALRHPHALRHAFATNCVEHGVNIVAVRNLLGHSSVKTTEIYTHLSVNSIQESYNKAFINRTKTNLL